METARFMPGCFVFDRHSGGNRNPVFFSACGAVFEAVSARRAGRGLCVAKPTLTEGNPLSGHPQGDPALRPSGLPSIGREPILVSLRSFGAGPGGRTPSAIAGCKGIHALRCVSRKLIESDLIDSAIDFNF